jgi:hypothetical protein
LRVWVDCGAMVECGFGGSGGGRSMDKNIGEDLTR